MFIFLIYLMISTIIVYLTVDYFRLNSAVKHLDGPTRSLCYNLITSGKGPSIRLLINKYLVMINQKLY
jgi:hypothetical protein